MSSKHRSGRKDRKVSKVNKEKKCWSVLSKILMENRGGIEVEHLYSEMKGEFDQDFVETLLQKYRRQHCLIAFVSRNPQVIKIRSKQTAKLLKENCTYEEHSVYSYIEETWQNGIWRKSLREKGQLSNDQCKKILKKLTKLNLIEEIAKKGSRQKILYIKGYSPSNKYENIFMIQNGKIDEAFVNKMYLRVKDIINNAGYQGISCKELISKEKNDPNPITNLKSIPVRDMERIINLLLFDGVIEVLPQTIPLDIRDEYCNETQNTICQIIKGINHKREKLDKLKNESLPNNSKSKIKTTPSKWKIKGKSIINQDCQFGTDTYQHLLETKFHFVQLEPKFDETVLIERRRLKEQEKEKQEKQEIKFKVENIKQECKDNENNGEPLAKRRKLNNGNIAKENKKISIKYESDDDRIIKTEKWDVDMNEFNFDINNDDDSPMLFDKKVKKEKTKKKFKDKDKGNDNYDDGQMINSKYNDEIVKAQDNIERYEEMKYRTLRYQEDSPYVHIPCNACPVRNKCTPGGIVNPTDCIYLNQWLGLT